MKIKSSVATYRFYAKGRPLSVLKQRKDGMVLYAGKWRTMESVEKHRAHMSNEARRLTKARLKRIESNEN